MDTKEIIKRRVERLTKLQAFNAPVVIIAHEAWMVFKACLVNSGYIVGNCLLTDIVMSESRELGICWSDKCTNPALDYKVGLCEKCLKEITDLDEQIDKFEGGD